MICGRTSSTPCSSLVAHSLHYSNSGVRWGYAQFINIQVLYFQVLHIEESKYVCRVGRGFKGFDIVDVVQSIVVYSMPSMLGVPRSQPRYWFCCSFFMEIIFFFLIFLVCPAEELLFRTGPLSYSRSSCSKCSVGYILSSLGSWVTVLEIYFPNSKKTVNSVRKQVPEEASQMYLNECSNYGCICVSM